jgi:uncharacterized protein (DUF488 family)
MNKVLSFGYGGQKADRLAAWIRKNGAILVDVRYSPSSSDEQWRKRNLVTLLGDQYVHLKEFGNENFKGTEIRIHDMAVGTMKIRRLLEAAPVVMMCACWNRSTCHRTVVIRHLVDEIGVEAAVLEPRELREPPLPPAQMSLL